MMHRTTVGLAASMIVSLAACKSNPQGEAAPSAPAAVGQAVADSGAVAEAKTVYSQRCAMCHGTTGVGDGPAAANLNPKPRNYTDKAWQASVNDAALAKIIVEGGAAVGKSMLMPGNPDLKSKPAVVNELIKIIRGFAK